MENKTTQEMIVDMDGISKILLKISDCFRDKDFICIITGLRLMANILEIGFLIYVMFRKGYKGISRRWWCKYVNKYSKISS
jgi:hypothetical protein